MNAVEFALTAPVLFMIIFGVFDCGWFLCNQAVLNSVTGDVARITSFTGVDTLENGFNEAADKASARWSSLGMKNEPVFTYEIMDQLGGLPSSIKVTAVVRYENLGPLDYFANNSLRSSFIVSWQGEWQ
jgi:hypothetical protein